MKLFKDCGNCDTHIAFSKSDMNEEVVWLKGAIFLVTTPEYKNKTKHYPVRYHDIEYKVTENCIRPCITCPVCGEKIWLCTDVGEGWWMMDMNNLKAEKVEIKSSTEWYNE